MTGDRRIEIALPDGTCTAKLNGLDPRAWLADMLRRIADHPASRLDELLPWSCTGRAAKLAA